MRYCYAIFANTEGGTIILGVEEKKGAFYLDILPDDLVDKYKKDFWNNVNNKSTISCNLLNALRKRCNACLLTQTTQHLTLAGLLMFGKYDAITDNACAPDFFPDYQEWLNEDPDARWTARIYPDGTWEANLFQYYRRVLPRLQNFLPTPFKLKGNTRVEETPAHVAVREAL